MMFEIEMEITYLELMLQRRDLTDKERMSLTEELAREKENYDILQKFAHDYEEDMEEEVDWEDVFGY